ncbi:hypothetical protein PV326_008514, partial [Microctonus aethiopoides]
MAEFYIFGQFDSAENFKQSVLFCKWSFHTGSGWKLINGNNEGQTQECRDLYNNKSAWNHPIDLHYTTQTLQRSPKLLVQIFSRDNHGRVLFIAYGTSSVPLIPGSHEIKCHTWKPIGNWVDRLRDKFLGMTLQLKTPSLLANSNDRFELLTETVGTVNIKLQIICKNFSKFGNIMVEQIFGINTEDYGAVTCSSENNCEESINHEITDVNNSEDINYATESNNNGEWELNNNVYTIGSPNVTKTISTTTLSPTISTPVATKMPSNINELMIKNLTSKLNSIKQYNVEICTCDLTISQCDINCCCDTDCTQFHLTIFSHCTDRQVKNYDSRYCYTKNFIQRNNTVFMLERLADNLFCIAYDNLPPIYSKSNAIKIKNRKQFDEIMMKNIEQKFTWTQNELFVPLNFDTSIPYRDEDVIWKIQSKSVKSIELPMSGFTNQCIFRRKLQYLKNFNSNCLQTILSNDNNDLFIDTYNNFSVISSPIFFNITSTSPLSSAVNDYCPKNICIPIETKYCSNSSSICDMTKPLEASCINGSCKNIVRKVFYIITHNGTMGIKKIQMNIELGNVSTSFYQHFDVQYQWADNNDEDLVYRSGNPGYLIGKPLIIGTLKFNTTDDIAMGNNYSNKTNYFLTVPLAQKNGDCYEDNRYIVALGEDLKLKCHVSLKTKNFSMKSCEELHDKILSIFFQQSLVNVTEIEHYKIYISKLGNITINNNNVSNWNQILLNKVPDKILRSEKTNEQIQCSSLTTSIRVDILYSLLPKPENIDNYKIIGIGVTLSDENIIWPKCVTRNCTDSLDIELVTYVKFHDISTPKTYYYAGGPNLDISLPYDFFYPFLRSECIRVDRCTGRKRGGENRREGVADIEGMNGTTALRRV